MGRYLDLAAGVIVGLDTDSQCEISELSEISPLRAPGLGYEISELSELSEISPQGETWGVAGASTKIVLLAVPAGVTEAWVQGVADLLAMPCPASCPEERWNVLREDSYTLLRDWAARAHELGWAGLDLFGAHPEKPLERFDCMGLVPVLNRARVVALSDTEATIEKPNGTRLTFHKRGQVPDETCLLWNLK